MMDKRDRLTIARILKVNHAGEYGAIRIYRAQISVAKRLYPDIAPFLAETLSHENNHCAMFRAAMPQRDARPCRIMALWGNGGLVLGFLTALLGVKAFGFVPQRSRPRFIGICRTNCSLFATETLNSMG